MFFDVLFGIQVMLFFKKHRLQERKCRTFMSKDGWLELKRKCKRRIFIIGKWQSSSAYLFAYVFLGRWMEKEILIGVLFMISHIYQQNDVFRWKRKNISGVMMQQNWPFHLYWICKFGIMINSVRMIFSVKMFFYSMMVVQSLLSRKFRCINLGFKSFA